MDNRESIIRKLNALKAKANDPSIKDTPEAISAMLKFNELMQRYNLALTDLEVKAEGIAFTSFKAKGKENAKMRNPMAGVVLRIKAISNTELVVNGFNGFSFIGTKSDVEYANFLYNLINNTMERAAIVYKMSVNYQRDINTSKLKGDEVMMAFKRGFVSACNTAINEMIDNNRGTGTSLMVIKNELITTFLNENGMAAATASKKAIAIPDHLADIAVNGYREGAKVKLRQELN